MTSALIKISNISCDRQLFVVRHEGAQVDLKSDTVLVIPDRWGAGPVACHRCLMTERQWRELDYQGEGFAIEDIPHLDDGDVVLFDKVCNRLEILFQVRSQTNSLYVTNACNSRCQFCPQPSTPDDGRLYELANGVVDLVDSAGDCINVTGGEPTIRRNEFVGLLKHMAEKWIGTKVFVLTNGRLLSDDTFVDEIYWARGESEIGFGIPLYADAASLHDDVVGAKGAFGQTIRGLYNLSRHHAEIEIRVVVSRLTYRRLPELMAFIGRNIPFITRVAVMGLEPMGYCRNRWEDFWIDPEDCQDCLARAAEVADNFGLTMLLYNFQLCCLPEALRNIACSTISEWKRVYIDKCWSCAMRRSCGGFFASQNETRYRPRKFI